MKVLIVEDEKELKVTTNIADDLSLQSNQIVADTFVSNLHQLVAHVLTAAMYKSD